MFRLFLFVCLTHLCVGDSAHGDIALNNQSPATRTLPPDCICVVKVIETLADGGTRELGSSEAPSKRMFPVRYTVSYTSGNSPQYIISAKITCPGDNGPSYSSDPVQYIPARQDGGDTDMDLTVSRDQ